MGVNAAGLSSKMLSFKCVMQELSPSVFMIQETKLKSQGKIKIENYIVFELLRTQQKGGGGLAMGVRKELNPILIREGNDEVEALSVEIEVTNMKIRCCVGYGCQESDVIERKNRFWDYLDQDVYQAGQRGHGFILHFDGNLWAGETIIPGDKRGQNRNGKLFSDFLQRNKNLTVVNSSPLCSGLVTRVRDKDGKLEESTLDFFVVCDRILPFVTSMVIDEDKKFILTNYTQVKKGGKAVDSDHYTQYMDVNLQYNPVKPVREFFLHYKNKKSQMKFKQLTTDTDEFTKCLNTNSSIIEKSYLWKGVLNKFCSKSFMKIRINKKAKRLNVNPKVSKLINERYQLRKQSKQHAKSDLFTSKIEFVNKQISLIEAQDKRDKLFKYYEKFSSDSENVNILEMWKYMGKICPKFDQALPKAKYNHVGKLLSEKEGIKQSYALEFKNRFRPRPVRPDLRRIEKQRNHIFNLCLQNASNIEARDINERDLSQALRDLKNNKSRDPHGFINELFKSGMCGDNLKKSLLILFNSLKENKIMPDFMKWSNITAIQKKKCSLDLKDHRGVSRLSVLRSLYLRILYNMKYEVIDSHISDGQMGGRRRKGCRNNIFIINSIIYDVLKCKNAKPLCLQIFDYREMFDSLSLKQSLIDIYSYGLTDETLGILYEANKEIKIAIKTPFGLTARETVEDSVLQGENWASLLASVQVDTIAKDCKKEGYFYLYKGILPVSNQSLVDDTVGLTEANYKAQQLNAFFNLKSAEKSLQFGPKKCKKMFVGKNCDIDLSGDLFVDFWKVTYSESKSSNEPVLNETYEGQVKMDEVHEWDYLGFRISNKNNNFANIRHVKSKSIGTTRKILMKLQSLNLFNYHFECGILFLKVMLRPSILYACETYINLTEIETRQIERIEESYLRQLFGAPRFCPIVQLYLESGIYPARFEIMKRTLAFLQYILKQERQSVIFQVLDLQIKNPVKGDFVSKCNSYLKQLKLKLNFDEIMKMQTKKFKNILRQQVIEVAFDYLMRSRKIKGSKINYSKLQTSEYILPNKPITDIEDKKIIFSIRNELLFPSFGEKKICKCETKLDTIHLYKCELLNPNKNSIDFEAIFNGTLKEIKSIMLTIKQNLQKL